MSVHQRWEDLIARRQELSEQDELALTEHLHFCPQCRQTAIEYARQRTLIRSLPYVEAPSALRAGVLAAVAEGGARPATRRTWRFPVPTFFLAPAALALIAVIGVLTYIHRPPTGSQNNAAMGVQTPASASHQKSKSSFGPIRTSRKLHAHPPTGAHKAARAETTVASAPDRVAPVVGGQRAQNPTVSTPVNAQTSADSARLSNVQPTATPSLSGGIQVGLGAAHDHTVHVTAPPPVPRPSEASAPVNAAAKPVATTVPASPLIPVPPLTGGSGVATPVGADGSYILPARTPTAVPARPASPPPVVGVPTAQPPTP